MARRTAIQTLDDITGESAGETVRFSLDGVDYDIDLSAENAAKLRGVLDRYIAHGRRTGGRKHKPRLIGEPTPPRRRTTRPERPARTPAPATPAEQPRQEAPVTTATRTVAQVPQVMFSAAST